MLSQPDRQSVFRKNKSRKEDMLCPRPLLSRVKTKWSGLAAKIQASNFRVRVLYKKNRLGRK